MKDYHLFSTLHIKFALSMIYKGWQSVMQLERLFFHVLWLDSVALHTEATPPFEHWYICFLYKINTDKPSFSLIGTGRHRNRALLHFPHSRLLPISARNPNQPCHPPLSSTELGQMFFFQISPRSCLLSGFPSPHCVKKTLSGFLWPA